MSAQTQTTNNQSYATQAQNMASSTWSGLTSLFQSKPKQQQQPVNPVTTGSTPVGTNIQGGKKKRSRKSRRVKSRRVKSKRKVRKSRKSKKTKRSKRGGLPFIA